MAMSGNLQWSPATPPARTSSLVSERFAGELEDAGDDPGRGSRHWNSDRSYRARVGSDLSPWLRSKLDALLQSFEERMECSFRALDERLQEQMDEYRGEMKKDFDRVFGDIKRTLDDEDDSYYSDAEEEGSGSELSDGDVSVFDEGGGDQEENGEENVEYDGTEGGVRRIVREKRSNTNVAIVHVATQGVPGARTPVSTSDPTPAKKYEDDRGFETLKWLVLPPPKPPPEPLPCEQMICCW